MKIKHLSKSDQAKAKANMEKQWEWSKLLSEEEILEIELMMAFDWEESNEKMDYWVNIHCVQN
jgi:hypothetical protein